jgi:hypothetical protein
MPKQLRSTKKGEKKKSQATIQIAKAEMTLTGFEHPDATFQKK